MNRIAIYGGSFNPVHFAHLRLAMDVINALQPNRFDFVPCANPPHKKGEGLLPFSMRYKLLEQITENYQNIYVNPLEAERNGPSYTFYTLEAYAAQYPNSELYFVLGTEDFDKLATWHRWRELLNYANFLIVARMQAQEDYFLRSINALFPQALKADDVATPFTVAYNVNEKSILYLPITRMDITATLVRDLWHKGKSIDFLVPDVVKGFLHTYANEVQKYWYN